MIRTCVAARIAIVMYFAGGLFAYAAIKSGIVDIAAGAGINV